jgi:hypothetical protein
LEVPQAIKLERSEDLSSIGPCEQGQIVVHDTPQGRATT